MSSARALATSSNEAALTAHGRRQGCPRQLRHRSRAACEGAADLLGSLRRRQHERGRHRHARPFRSATRVSGRHQRVRIQRSPAFAMRSIRRRTMSACAQRWCRARRARAWCSRHRRPAPPTPSRSLRPAATVDFRKIAYSAAAPGQLHASSSQAQDAIVRIAGEQTTSASNTIDECDRRRVVHRQGGNDGGKRTGDADGGLRQRGGDDARQELRHAPTTRSPHRSASCAATTRPPRLQAPCWAIRC